MTLTFLSHCSLQHYQESLGAHPMHCKPPHPHLYGVGVGIASGLLTDRTCTLCAFVVQSFGGLLIAKFVSLMRM